MCARHDHPPYDSDWTPPYPDHPDDAGLMGEPELATPHPATDALLREALDDLRSLLNQWHFLSDDRGWASSRIETIIAALAATPPASALREDLAEVVLDEITPPASAERDAVVEAAKAWQVGLQDDPERDDLGMNNTETMLWNAVDALRAAENRS